MYKRSRFANHFSRSRDYCLQQSHVPWVRLRTADLNNWVWIWGLECEIKSASFPNPELLAISTEIQKNAFSCCIILHPKHSWKYLKFHLCTFLKTFLWTDLNRWNSAPPIWNPANCLQLDLGEFCTHFIVIASFLYVAHYLSPLPLFDRHSINNKANNILLVDYIVTKCL